METDTAKKINQNLCMASMASEGLAASVDYEFLRSLSLEDMLTATKIMNGEAGETKHPDGTTSFTMVVAERGIAMIFTALHWPAAGVGWNGKYDPIFSLRGSDLSPVSALLHIDTRGMAIDTDDDDE